MVQTTWGIKGDPVLWSVDVSKLQQGSCIDLVATVVSIVGDGSSLLVSLFPCGTRARIEGLSAIPADTDMISIYGAVFGGEGMVPTFQIHEQSLVMWFPKPTYEDLLHIRELCSGMGIATEGLIQSGFFPKVACDWRMPFMEAYGLLHPDVTTIPGDKFHRSCKTVMASPVTPGKLVRLDDHTILNILTTYNFFSWVTHPIHTSGPF